MLIHALAAWSLLASGGVAVPPPASKVLIIGVDGLRADAMLAAHTPAIDRLMANGCFTSVAHTGDATVSGPGWSSFLCGVWRDKHGVSDNTFRGASYGEYPHFMARLAEVAPGMTTAHFADWLPIDQFIVGEYEPSVRFAVDYADDGDNKTVDAVLDMFGRTRPDVTFVYFADVDTAGHTWGFHPKVQEYIAEIEEVDGQIGLILDAVFGHAAAEHEDWLIILSTDHGGTIDGSHGRNEPLHREIPLIVSGARAAKGVLYDTANQVDIPATALAHLHVEQKASWNWDGRPIGLRQVTPLHENLVFNGDAEYSRGYPGGEPNGGIAGWQDLGAATVVRYGSPTGFPDELASERIRGGKNFFCGGGGGNRLSEIEQRIGVVDRASEIDLGVLRYEFGAHLGGYADQRDCATAYCEFLDERSGVLGRAQLGPVMTADRQGELTGFGVSVTGLVWRETSGEVPRGTRVLRVRVVMEGAAGDNDGYADNISLVLRSK